MQKQKAALIRPNLRLIVIIRGGPNPPEPKKTNGRGYHVLEAERRHYGGFGRRSLCSRVADGLAVGQGRRVGGSARQSGTPPAAPRPAGAGTASRSRSNQRRQLSALVSDPRHRHLDADRRP